MDKVGICNVALGLLGGPRITSLDDPGDGARLCRDNWTIAQDQALQEKAWTFATQRLQLDTPEAAAPEYGFTKAFKLPGNVLRVLEVMGPDEQALDWAAEGRTILADTASVFVKALVREENTALWSPGFCAAVAYLLASRICVGLTENEGREVRLRQLYEAELRKAAAQDGKQGRGEVPRFQSARQATRY